MSLRGTRRWGLGLLLWAAVFACLNPRPDDQPLFSDRADRPNETPVTPPSTGDDGDNLLEADGSGSSDPSVNSGSPGPRGPGDAGPADAGPVVDADAGAVVE